MDDQYTRITIESPSGKEVHLIPLPLEQWTSHDFSPSCWCEPVQREDGVWVHR